jgi:hypothetical protein
MGGGLVQLAAYGSQDVYLTTNPQITYFKSVYRRYTNFAIESINQLIEGNPDFDGNITIVVSRNGDLVGSINLEVSLFSNPQNYIQDATTWDYCGWIQGVGNYLIDNATISIGSQQIDNQYGKWMDIWSELVLTGSQLTGYGTLIGKNYSSAIWQPYDVSCEPDNRLTIPLQFWFCRNPGLAIPLIALQYHEVKLMISFEKFVNLVVGVNNGEYQPIIRNGTSLPRLGSLKVWNTYYYLDTLERRKFAQNPHEYLIEQVQSQLGNLVSLSEPNYIRLNLNHPTKELIFIFNRNNSNAPINDFSLGTDIIPNGTPNQFAPLNEFKLILNGTDRFKERNGEYFRVLQTYDHHTRTPGNYIYSYSFALRPEEHQPSGTCNFSRIDTAQLYFTIRNGVNGVCQDYNSLPEYTVYAPCYNILRIMGGMGGLAYSN